MVDKINFRRDAGEPWREECENDTGTRPGGSTACPTCSCCSSFCGAVFVEKPLFLREGIDVCGGGSASYFSTKKSIHAANHFDFHPIQEVAILFAGIFATMIPALDWLNHEQPALLGNIPRPAFFTGARACCPARWTTRRRTSAF